MLSFPAADKMETTMGMYIVSFPLKISDGAISNAFACLAEGYAPYNLLNLLWVWIVQP